MRLVSTARRGFTLIEMIGVMTIIAIAAALLVPNMVRQMQTASAAGEDAVLDGIAQALTNAIKATGFIPNPNVDPTSPVTAAGYGWATLASNYTALGREKLLSVFPSATNETQRRLYLSTNLAGVASSGGFGNTLSNWGATPFPTNAKMYLVSASRPDFSLALRTNGPSAQVSANTFASSSVTALEGWTKQVVNGVVAAPATLVGPILPGADRWTNQGEFLHVRTVDLTPIFNEARAAQQKISDQEDKNLEEIARALIASIQANGQIPNPNASSTNTTDGWVFLASSFSSLGQEAFRYSFPLVSTNERRMYLDTNIAILPLSTPSGGWPVAPNVPASLFIVSSSKQDLDLSCLLNGVGANNSVTNSLNWLRGWSRSSSLPIINTIAPWTDRGEFLHVKTIDLKALFCRVELEDLCSPVTANTTTATGTNYGVMFTQTNSGVTLSFTANGSGNLSSVSVVSPPGMNSWGAITNKSNSNTTVPVTVTEGGGSNAVVNLIFPAVPLYAAGLGAPSPMPTQTVVFYVLKGGSINLSGASFVVQQDVKYQFSNGTWRQVY